MTEPGVQIKSVAEIGDTEAFWSIRGDWPTWIEEDPSGAVAYPMAVDLYPELHTVLFVGDEPVGRVHAVPVARWTVDELPARGWDAVLERSAPLAIEKPWTLVSLIEARIDPAHRGKGYSSLLLAAQKQRCAALGVHHLVGPVRPTEKTREPHTPIADYAYRTRDDGLPTDPWLRTHVRVGGRIHAICAAAMTIPGSLDQWRAWTGLPFDTSGDVIMDFALNPIHVDVAADHAVYVEPGVWIIHDLTGTGRALSA